MGLVWTFVLSSIISLLSPSLWETARYRLKYYLKGPLTQNNQPTKLNNRQPQNEVAIFIPRSSLSDPGYSNQSTSNLILFQFKNYYIAMS